MERLTQRCNGVVVYVGPDNPETTGQIASEIKPSGVRRLLERLAGYEDTWLDVDDIEMLRVAVVGRAIATITELNGVPFERLCVLAEADKAGRVVIRPAKKEEVKHD